MMVHISVCDGSGWQTFLCSATEGADKECYALPKEHSRSKFWGGKTGQSIPEGRAIVWDIVS